MSFSIVDDVCISCDDGKGASSKIRASRKPDCVVAPRYASETKP